MKILHIINTLETGGAQSVLVQLLEGWKDESNCQMVISLRQRGQLSGRIEALNIPVEHINLRPGKIELIKFIQLVRMIKKFKPDIVQTWLYHACLIGSLAVRSISRAPIVWGIHHTISNKFSVKFATWNVVRILSRFSARIPSRIICCSESAYLSHLDIGFSKNRMITIVNGVDTDRFQPDPGAKHEIQKELGLSRQANLIGAFARFHPQKDHNTLIEAAGILLNGKFNVHFVLAGEGVDPSNLQLLNRIAQTGFPDNFHLLGNRQDMPRLNAGMDIITLSSAYGEALPMALCEGMSSARPCVATNIGDAAKLIGNTGRVVEPENPTALAAAWQNILELSGGEYHQICGLARQKILETYDLKNMISQYRFIYQELKKSSS